MDPTTIWAAVEAGVKLITSLSEVADQLSNVERNLQSLQQEVIDLNGVLTRIAQDFSGPRRSWASQAGTVGNHWTAVGLMIQGCKSVLSEMNALLCAAPSRSGTLWDKPFRAAWLRLKESDVAFYRAEIQNRTRLLQVELTMVVVYEHSQMKVLHMIVVAADHLADRGIWTIKEVAMVSTLTSLQPRRRF